MHMGETARKLRTEAGSTGTRGEVAGDSTGIGHGTACPHPQWGGAQKPEPSLGRRVLSGTTRSRHNKGAREIITKLGRTSTCQEKGNILDPAQTPREKPKLSKKQLREDDHGPVNGGGWERFAT